MGWCILNSHDTTFITEGLQMNINDIFWMWIIGSLIAVFWITVNEEA